MEVASSCGVLTGGDANTTKRWAAKNACTARDDIIKYGGGDIQQERLAPQLQLCAVHASKGSSDVINTREMAGYRQCQRHAQMRHGAKNERLLNWRLDWRLH